jgi:hypothetical protein
MKKTFTLDLCSSSDDDDDDVCLDKLQTRGDDSDNSDGSKSVINTDISTGSNVFDLSVDDDDDDNGDNDDKDDDDGEGDKDNDDDGEGDDDDKNDDATYNNIDDNYTNKSNVHNMVMEEDDGESGRDMDNHDNNDNSDDDSEVTSRRSNYNNEINNKNKNKKKSAEFNRRKESEFDDNGKNSDNKINGSCNSISSKNKMNINLENNYEFDDDMNSPGVYNTYNDSLQYKDDKEIQKILELEGEKNKRKSKKNVIILPFSQKHFLTVMYLAYKPLGGRAGVESYICRCFICYTS